MTLKLTPGISATFGGERNAAAAPSIKDRQAYDRGAHDSAAWSLWLPTKSECQDRLNVVFATEGPTQLGPGGCGGALPCFGPW